jgi:hypothetical protein
MPGEYSRPIKQEKPSKAIPSPVWTGPEGSRRFRLPDMKTVVRLSAHTHRPPFTLQEIFLVLISFRGLVDPAGKIK